MYAITDRQRAEITTLLAALEQLPGSDIKSANTRRKAVLAIRKLNKAKKL